MVATIVTAPLFVRMTPDELGMVRAAASGQLLSASSWARRIIMGALEAFAAVGEAEGLARAAAAAAQGPVASPRRANAAAGGARPALGPVLASAAAAARTLPLPFDAGNYTVRGGKRKKLTSKVLAPKAAKKTPKPAKSKRRKALPKRKGGR